MRAGARRCRADLRQEVVHLIGDATQCSTNLPSATRRIALTVPDFLLGPYVVAETALLLSAGQRLLRSFVGQLPVQVVALPFELPAFDVYMVWHARVHSDPAFVWFRNQLAAVHDQP